MTTITGNTYPVRSIIRDLKFSWNKRLKQWERSLPLTPDEESTLAALRGLIIENLASQDDRDYIDTRSYKQKFGRCEDAPCCGCCGPTYYSSNGHYDY